MASILITGGAGFIGYHLQQYLKEKHQVAAIDLLARENTMTQQRAKHLPNILKSNIQEDFLDKMDRKPELVVHLAAETGIPGSLKNPEIYFQNNVAGTFNVLEQCRKNKVKSLVYASSSSVYAPHQSIMKESSDTESQLSFYGSTKKICETMVHNYCRQFGIKAVGLRFFTVYGSWTRPDMAAFKFMNAIDQNREITLYNDGAVSRDFTHVSDIVKAIEKVIAAVQQEKPGTHRIFNIGKGSPVSVKEYATLIADNLGRPLQYHCKKLPENELEHTHADTSALEAYTGFKPECKVQSGVAEMVEWYKNFRHG